MQASLITATMPVRDRVDLLEGSARSVLAQRDVDLELVILDDGSTDGSWELAQRIAAEDDRVRVLRNESSSGIPAARNRLLAEARGQYVAITDSDDLLEPTAFARQIEHFAAAGSIAGVGVGIRVFEKDPTTGHDPGWHWGLCDGRLPFAFAGAMFRTEALREVGGFDERWPVAEDLQLCYRLHAAGYTFAAVPEPLLNYRVHGGAASGRARRREWYNLRAQLQGLRLLRGRFSPRGYAVILQSVLRVSLATVGLRR